MGHVHHIQGTYDMFLVIVSYLIAVTASYSALDLASRISMSKGSKRIIWLVCGATSMGLGIWSMHFVGMLSMSLPVKVSYHIDDVVISVILAISVSSISLFTIARKNIGIMELVLSGLLMAVGISGMHYVGMEAMMIGIIYDTSLVILSVAISVSASAVALWLLFYFRKDQQDSGTWYKLGSALIMGGGIAGMHYTGMYAAHFYIDPSKSRRSTLLIDPAVLAYIIACATFLLLGMTLFGIFITKRLSQKDSVIQEHAGWYRSLYENNVDGIISVDTNGRIISMNPAVIQMIGGSAEEYILQNISNIEAIIAEGEDEGTRKVYHSQTSFATHSYDTAVMAKDGRRLELKINIVPVEIEGELAGNHIIARDITEEKQAKEQIKHLAYHDDLTGLPNRRMFNEILAKLIQESERYGRYFGVMALDIDRFKLINDSLGHTYGDIFLQAVSQRLISSVADYEATISRLGGDEFIVLCRTNPEGTECEELATRIVEEMRQPFHLKDNDFYISTSVGTAIYPKDSKDPVELIKKADAAMYEVKKHGKNGHQFYTPDLDIGLLGKIELEGDLRKAVQRNELVLHYQPQVSTTDSKMIGVEALVRWNHPTRGLLMPGAFIPLAEDTGMISEIGNWVIREACRQMKEWHDAGGPLIPVSVNLSTQQFHHSNLTEQVRVVLHETGLPSQYLELEITESMMMDAGISTTILHELNKLGIRISLDDFGTGYSSLSYLKTFPIHKLKIDKSFIADISSNENDKAIVATIISMAQHLKLDVIAEGIETKEQLDILTEKECREIQGYYFSKPLPAADVETSFFVPLRQMEFAQD
ncbi:hypothetical protein ABD86_23880 [Paenibacillus alvei]|nr:hypothetical protein [Paenibacillus alvei]MBG9746795.1 hypothetical protein [Paenibacillus alvei]